jgi:hypothetical protein
MPGSSQWSLPFRFPNQDPVNTSPLPHPCHTSCPPHPPWYNHPNDIQWRIQIMKFIIIIWCNFLYALSLTILTSYINLSTYSSLMKPRKFHLILVQNLLEMSSREPHPQSTPKRRPNPQTSQMTWLERWLFKHLAATG